MLRNKLEKTQIDIENKIQETIAGSENINKQLKLTIKSLRYKLETKDVLQLEEIHRREIQKRDEHTELAETIIILRDKLEEIGGEKKI